MNKINKAQGAQTNSYYVEVKGVSVRVDTRKGQSVNTGVLFTSDTDGETLSIYDPSTKKQITVPFEDVERLIEYTRQKKEELQ